MADPTQDEIETARGAIVDLMREEFRRRNAGSFDAHEFGNAVAPLVNALAALSLIERRDERHSGPGEASRSDD